MSELHPHVALADKLILSVAALPGGGYAALTDAGIERFDAALAKRETIAVSSAGGGRLMSQLVVLSGDRFLLHDRALSPLAEAAIGGAIERVDLAGELVRSVVVTAAGFLAIATHGVLVDIAGRRTFVKIEGRLAHGGAAWRGGAVIAGHDGLAILGHDGAVLAQSKSVGVQQRPVALASKLASTLAAPTYDGDIAIFDDAARVTARIPVAVSHYALVAYQTGVLVRHADGHVISYWDLAADRPTEVWRFASNDALQEPIVIGEYVVLRNFAKAAWILDGMGQTIAQLALAGTAHDVIAFAGGAAFVVQNAPAILWWRPGRDGATTTELAHDIEPRGALAVPAGLVSFEGPALYLWSVDSQGPNVTQKVACEYPIGVPLVVGNGCLTILGPGRLFVRGMMPGGRLIGVAPGLPWRPVTTRDEAVPLIEKLAQREFAEVTLADDAPILRLPLAQTVDLHGRAMFAASSISPELKRRADSAREAFFAELADAIGTTGRALRAAVRARKTRLDPPRPILGYEYLGTFTTNGQLLICDPAYLSHLGSKTGGSLALATKVTAQAGRWHVFAKNGSDSARDCTAELAAIHDAGFEVHATELLAHIGVDSGCAGIWDKQCPRRDPNALLEEGTFAGLGAIAWSGHGDGAYPVFAGKRHGTVAKLRLVFLGDAPEIDHLTVKAAASAAKPYSVTTKFAVGDTLEHVKFGIGSVLRVLDSKIDVRFADATRTLIHAKK